MPSWDRRLLDSTRGQILQLIRGGTHTVNELATQTQLTDNAVRAHLVGLERDGLIVQTGLRPGTRRPTHTYDLTPQAEQLFPKAYGGVLAALLDVLQRRLSTETLESAVKETAHQLAAPHLPAVSGKPTSERRAYAIQTLRAMGGLPQLVEEDGRPTVRGRRCPLAEAVPGHPEVCLLAATLIGDLVGSEVHERCHRAPGEVHCVFDLPTDQ